MSASRGFGEGAPPFDEELAASILGKYVLVGLTYVDENGELITQQQFHGDVIDADATRGFCLKLRGRRQGEIYWLPPDTRAFREASPGEYRLRSTAEVVLNPDYTCTWTFERQPKQ